MISSAATNTGRRDSGSVRQRHCGSAAKCTPSAPFELPVFALLYWELDGGGPESRADGYQGRYPDLVFPQQQADQQGLAPAIWKPSFYDYVYVSLTSAVAFSPTDAMPYSKWAKLTMGAESVLSFATLAVVVARAVNIAHG